MIDVVAAVIKKNNKYLNCPSGGPMVQHTILSLLQNCEKYGVSIRDKEGRHVYSYGAKALSKFGFSEETFQGKTTSEALGEQYNDVDAKALETVNTMQPTVSHKIYKTSKHSSKVTQYFFPNFNENNKVTGTISFAVISEIK